MSCHSSWWQGIPHEIRQQRNFCHRSCCVCMEYWYFIKNSSNKRARKLIIDNTMTNCIPRKINKNDTYLLRWRRSWGRPVSVVSWMLEVRYVGVCPANWLVNLARELELHPSTNRKPVQFLYEWSNMFTTPWCGRCAVNGDAAVVAWRRATWQ